MYIAKQVFNNALRRKSMFSIKKFENISNIDIKMMKYTLLTHAYPCTSHK